MQNRIWLPKRNTTTVYAGPFGAASRTVRFRMAKTADRVGEVYIYDVIGDGWGDGTTAKSFATDLKTLGELDTLNVYINSPGGIVSDGVAIYNQLVRSRARKMVYIDGIAASIASVVAMAGDEIIIAKNAMMMIHDPWAFMMGTAEELRHEANVLDAIRDTLIETYAERANADPKDVAKWMKAETWFNGQECVDAGLADRICEKDVEIAALATIATPDNLRAFKNVPESLRKISNSVVAPIVEPKKPVSVNTGTAADTRSAHPALLHAAAALQRRRLVTQGKP